MNYNNLAKLDGAFLLYRGLEFKGKVAGEGMKEMMRKAAVLLLSSLMLAVILAASGVVPAYADSIPDNVPSDPWATWLPPTPASDGRVLDIPGAWTLQEAPSLPVAGTKVNIAQAYFVNTEKSAKTQFIAQDGWYLIVQVNMSGRLYLYEYAPPDSIPKGRWLGYNTPISEGTWQIGPFYAQPMEPEGEHVWKLWLFSQPDWATATSTFTYLRKEYTDPPEIAFTAEPAAIKSGESGMLAWNVTGAAAVDIQPDIGRVGPSGQRKITPAKTTTYSLSASNNVGKSTKSADVSVSAVAGLPAWLIWVIIAGLAVVGGVIAYVIIRRRSSLEMAEESETALQDNPTITASPPTVTRNKTIVKTTVKTAVKTKLLNSETAMAEGKLILPNGNEVLLSTASKWIGRADFAGIIPDQDDNFISRQHVLITFEGGEYFVEDRNSGNGTRLNGADIKGKGNQKLNDGDKIELAEAVTVVFRRS